MLLCHGESLQSYVVFIVVLKRHILMRTWTDFYTHWPKNTDKCHSLNSYRNIKYATSDVFDIKIGIILTVLLHVRNILKPVRVWTLSLVPLSMLIQLDQCFPQAHGVAIQIEKEACWGFRACLVKKNLDFGSLWYILLLLFHLKYTVKWLNASLSLPPSGFFCGICLNYRKLQCMPICFSLRGNCLGLFSK